MFQNEKLKDLKIKVFYILFTFAVILAFTPIILTLPKTAEKAASYVYPTPKPKTSPTPTPTPALQREIFVSDDLPGINIKQSGNLGVGLNIFDAHGVGINIEKGDIRLPNAVGGGSGSLRIKDSKGIDQSILYMAGDSLRLNNPVNGGIMYLQRDAQASNVPAGVYLFGGNSNQSEGDFVLDSVLPDQNKPKRNSSLLYQWGRIYNGGQQDILSSVSQVEASMDGPVGTREGIVHQWFGTLDQEALFVDYIMNGGPRYNIKFYQPITLVPRTPPAIPEEGMLIYNQNLKKMQFWTGSKWETLTSQ